MAFCIDVWPCQAVLILYGNSICRQVRNLQPLPQELSLLVNHLAGGGWEQGRSAQPPPQLHYWGNYPIKTYQINLRGQLQIFFMGPATSMEFYSTTTTTRFKDLYFNLTRGGEKRNSTQLIYYYHGVTNESLVESPQIDFYSAFSEEWYLYKNGKLRSWRQTDTEHGLGIID